MRMLEFRPLSWLWELQDELENNRNINKTPMYIQRKSVGNIIIFTAIYEYYIQR